MTYKKRVARLERLSPATGHIRCALLANQPKQVESAFVGVSLFIP